MTWLNEYQQLDGVRLNMIATPDGKFVGSNGSSRDISNSLDRALILRLRELSDVYVTGGKTYRTEGYRTPKQGKLAVITTQPSSLPNGVLALGAETAIESLQSLGFRRILLEVGPSLAAKYLNSDLIDEFCLTIPNGLAADAYKTAASLGSNLNLVSETTIEGTLFTRWRRGND
jgi:riboflavin biosynthesis pyrimidine reductase